MWSLIFFFLLSFFFIFAGGDEVGEGSNEDGSSVATTKVDNMTCRSKECRNKPLQVVSTQLPYVFRYLANELFAMNIRMNLNVSSSS